MIPRAAATALVGLLPAGRGKNAALNHLGHDVHRRARVDPLLLLRVGRLELGDRAHLGAFTVVRNVRTLRLGPHAAIGPHNWVSAAAVLHGHSDAAGCLSLGDRATVSTRHRLDCSGGISLGAGAAIAGWDTLVMTHDASVDGSTLTAAPVTIGARTFVHAANRIAAGSTLAHDVRTELGTVVHGEDLAASTRYAGNPAVPVGAVPRSLTPAPQPTVVHVLPTVDDAFGGPGPVLAAWLAADDRRGGGVRVFGTVTRPGAVASRLAALAPVDFAAPGKVLGRFYGNAAQLRRLSTAVAGADLVVSHSFFHVPGLVAAWQARRSGVPWAIAPHGSLDPWDVAAHHARVKQTLAPLWRRVLARAVVWCVTPREAEELVTFGARPPSEVIPCPADVTPTLPVDDALRLLGPLGDRLRVALDDGGRVVSFVGRFDLKKGVARLVDAFDAAAGAHDVLVLAGTGDAEWERRVDDAIAGARRSAQIVRPGWIGPEAKIALWSLPGPFALVSDNENFGVAVAEAMACGRPVLVTDRVALAPMIAAGGAGLVTTTAHDEIVRALQRLLRDDALADRLGRQGSALVRDQLSIAAVAGRYREAVAHSLRTAPTPATLTERIA